MFEEMRRNPILKSESRDPLLSRQGPSCPRRLLCDLKPESLWPLGMYGSGFEWFLGGGGQGLKFRGLRITVVNVAITIAATSCHLHQQCPHELLQWHHLLNQCASCLHHQSVLKAPMMFDKLLILKFRVGYSCCTFGREPDVAVSPRPHHEGPKP